MTSKGKSEAAGEAAVSSKGRKKAVVEKPPVNPDLERYGAIAVRRAEETGQQVAWAFDEMLRQVTCMTVPAEEASRLQQVVLLPGIHVTTKEEGPREARVMLVGSWPNTAETQACRLMHGDWVPEFEALAAKSGFPSDCYYTTLVKHSVDGKKPAIPKDLVDSFMPALKREIEVVGPEMVVLLGSKVLKAVLGAKATADSMRGRTLSAEESPLGVRTAAVMDFSSIQYSPENRGPIGLELSRLANELAGPAKAQERVETEYIYCRGVEQLREHVDRIRREAVGYVSVDCEWGGSNPQDGWLRCVQFSWAPGKAWEDTHRAAGAPRGDLGGDPQADQGPGSGRALHPRRPAMAAAPRGRRRARGPRRLGHRPRRAPAGRELAPGPRELHRQAHRPGQVRPAAVAVDQVQQVRPRDAGLRRHP
jgi:uracil-DNA glycosylase family 4